jgi:putative ABC transport system permease protein
MLTGLAKNLRYAGRLLRKSPGFTAVAVITLALGIGASTAIYSVIYAALLAPMPYPNPDQLVVVWSKPGDGRNVVSAGDFLEWKAQNTVFQDLNAWTGSTFNLATSERPEQIDGQVTTPGFYTMMGVPFELGRDFLPEEGQPGKEHVVILAHSLWVRMGARRDIVGQPIRMNGEPYTVVGVMAAGPTDRLRTKLVVPLAFKPEQINHTFHWVLVMGRLKPGVTLAMAQADMNLVARRIAQDHPDTNKTWGARVDQLKNDFLPEDTRSTLWLLMGAVGFVLLIACVNVANLLLAKSTVRRKEVAVRASLGATRGQLFAQFLTESLALAVVGGVAGVGLGMALIRVLMAIMPPFTLPSEAEVGLSVPVLLFTSIATLLSAVLFGCAPALQASGVKPNEALKEGGRSGTGSGRHGLRRALVVMEFALALTLLDGAGLAIHSFWNLSRIDLGVDTHHILTFSLPVPEGRLIRPEEIVAFYRQLLEKLRAVPGVVQAEVATGTPLQGTDQGMGFTIVGQPPVEHSARPDSPFQAVSPGYFQTFGVRVVKGRTFTDQDTASSVRVAMVNENFVKRYLKGTDPIGQRIAIDQLIPGVPGVGPTVEWQIVGVFHNVRSFGPRDEDHPEIDVPFAQSPWPQTHVAVRTAGDPVAMSQSIAAVVNSMDPDLALAYLKTMEQIANENLSSDRFAIVLYASFAGVALLLAAIGIYGVMAFAVAQRTHEIGLRMALGAGREQVLRLVLTEGMMLALAGLALVLVGACFVGRAMRSILYGVSTVDPRAFALVAAALLTSAGMACYLPARRAAKVEPMVALRYE